MRFDDTKEEEEVVAGVWDLGSWSVRVGWCYVCVWVVSLDYLCRWQSKYLYNVLGGYMRIIGPFAPYRYLLSTI